MTLFSKKAQLARSPKTQKEKREIKLSAYEEAKNLREQDHFWCERCQVEVGHECHHLAGRDGDLIATYANLRMLCTPCHKWIHDNPKEAKATGWMIDRNAIKAPAYMALKAKSVVKQVKTSNPKRGH